MSGVCVGSEASVFVSIPSSTCLRAPPPTAHGFPLCAGWRQLPHVAHGAPSICPSSRPPHALFHLSLHRSHPPPPAPSHFVWHALIQSFWSPLPRLGQAAPPHPPALTLTGFPRGLSVCPFGLHLPWCDCQVTISLCHWKRGFLC